MVFGGVLILIHYRFLTTGNRIEKINEEFESAPRPVQRRRIVMITIYTVVSILFIPLVFAPLVFLAVAMIVLVCSTPLLIILLIIWLVKKRKKNRQRDILERN